MIKVGNRMLEWRSGMTVSEAIQRVGYDFPYFFVTVNGTVVRTAELHAHLLPDGADVQIYPIVAGG